MYERMKVIAEWFFEYEDGEVQGPFSNSFSPEGLAKIAEAVQSFPSSYLVLGDDTAEGYTIEEVFRKPVSVVTRDDNVVRFRTQLLTGEANGDHQKTCIYVDAADTPGTGIMLNMLTRYWSKTSNMILAVECRITVSGVS